MDLAREPNSLAISVATWLEHCIITNRVREPPDRVQEQNLAFRLRISLICHSLTIYSQVKSIRGTGRIRPAVGHRFYQEVYCRGDTCCKMRLTEASVLPQLPPTELANFDLGLRRPYIQLWPKTLRFTVWTRQLANVNVTVSL